MPAIVSNARIGYWCGKWSAVLGSSLGDGDAHVDSENSVPCLQFWFDLLASLRHGVRSSRRARHRNLRLSLGLFVTLTLNFP